MVLEGLNPSIDSSLFVWDESDFNANKHKYYDVISSLVNFMSAFKNQNFILTSELNEHLINNYPYSNLPNELRDIGSSVYKFLANIQFIGSRFNTCNSELLTMPIQTKSYFKDELKSEIENLMNDLLNNFCDDCLYFSCKHFWDDSNVLKIKCEQECEIEVFHIDDEEKLAALVESLTLKFQHSTKHDCAAHADKNAWKRSNEKGNFVSQLSSFEDSNRDAVQSILDARFNKKYGNGNYYSYDFRNEVYVIFRITEKNIYHAHDEYDINDIPNEVKNHFNIKKYNWL